MSSRSFLWGLLLLAILPIWLFTYLPVSDLPEHMLIAKILVSYDDPAFDYSQHFTKQVPWKPYSTYFWFTSLSGPFLGIPIATKLYITAIFVLSVLALRTWILTVSPSREPNVVLAIPLLYGTFFYIGVINYLFSLPFVFFALALGWRIASGKPRAADIAALSAAMLAIWFSHPVPFALAGVLLGVQAVFLFRGRNFSYLMVAGVVPAIVVILYALFSASNDIASLDWAYEPWRMRLALYLLPFGIYQDTLTGGWRLLPGVPVFWLVFVFASAATVLQREKRDDDNSHGTLLVAVLLAAAVLALPSTIAGGLGVAMLAAQPAAMAAVAALPAAWYRQHVLRYVTLSICAAALILIGYRFRQFQPEMRDFERVAAVIPARQRIQPILVDPHTPYLNSYPFLHVAAWYHQWKGGISPYLFTKVAHFPVRERTVVMSDAPGEWTMANFEYARNQRGTDYFIVRGADAGILEDLKTNVPIAAEAGAWKVFGPNPQP